VRAVVTETVMASADRARALAEVVLRAGHELAGSIEPG